MKERRYAVAGGGYVGLSIAVALSCTQDVVIYDLDETKVNMINNRVSPLHDELIEKFLGERDLNLRATTNYRDAFCGATGIIIAVPTNYDPFTKYFDVSLVDDIISKAIESVPGTPIIIKSTIPIGYCDNAIERFEYPDIFFSPEFLREGRALEDVLNPHRTIIGLSEPKNDDSMHHRNIINFLHNYVNDLLHEYGYNRESCMMMSNKDAECVKLFANTYLAGRVAFFNELDSFAMNHGLDAKKIISGVCADPRIGRYYNNPSFGYGGYCFPKDTKQLVANFESTDDIATDERLISAIVESNAVRKRQIANWVIKFLDDVKKETLTVGVYKLAMKSGSDNHRCSAVLDIINMLREYVTPDGRKINIVIYDDNLRDAALIVIEDKLYTVENDRQKFIDECDCILTNRMHDVLEPVKDKVLTRDAFGVD